MKPDVLTAQTVTDDQIRKLRSRMGVSPSDKIIRLQCEIALATYIDQYLARQWCAEYLNAEADRAWSEAKNEQK